MCREREQSDLRQRGLVGVARRQEIIRRRIVARNLPEPLALREQQRREDLRHRADFKLRVRRDRPRIVGREFPRREKRRAIAIDPRDGNATRFPLRKRIEPRLDVGGWFGVNEGHKYQQDREETGDFHEEFKSARSFSSSTSRGSIRRRTASRLTSQTPTISRPTKTK